MKKTTILHKAVEETVDKYSGYITIIIAALIASVALLLIGTGLEALLSAALGGGFTSFTEYLSFRGPYSLLIVLVQFIFSTYFMGLLVLNSFNGKGVRENIQKLHKNFIEFLLLNILLLIVALIAFGPLYAITLLVLANAPFQGFLLPLLFVILVTLLILVPLWFIVTPYALLDHSMSVKKAIYYTFKKVKKKQRFMLGRILLALTLLVIFALAQQYINLNFPALDLVVGLFFLFFLTPFFYSYFKVTYDEID